MNCSATQLRCLSFCPGSGGLNGDRCPFAPPHDSSTPLTGFADWRTKEAYRAATGVEPAAFAQGDALLAVAQLTESGALDGVTPYPEAWRGYFVYAKARYAVQNNVGMVPRRFRVGFELTLPDPSYCKLHFEPGLQMVPANLLDHWYVQANLADVLSGPVWLGTVPPPVPFVAPLTPAPTATVATGMTLPLAMPVPQVLVTGTGTARPQRSPRELPRVVTMGEVVAWRIWCAPTTNVREITNAHLLSFAFDTLWPVDEPLKALPSDRGMEGIWAFKERDSAIRKARGDLGMIWGTVALWGEVVEHQIGWRAEFARILSLDGYHGKRPPRERQTRADKRYPSRVLTAWRRRYRVGSFVKWQRDNKRIEYIVNDPC